MKWLLIAFTLFLSPLFADASAPINHLLASFDWDRPEPFHGAGLFFDADSRNNYFVTNAHVIPTDKKKQKALIYKGSLTGNTRAWATVVGRAPGYDIAVVSVPRDWRYGIYPDRYRQRLQQIAMPRLKAPISSRLGVVGFNGPYLKGSFEWTDRAWVEEMKLWADWKPFVQTRPILGYKDLSPVLIPTEITTDCPPVFLEECYKIPIRTHGYSGGVVLSGANLNVNYTQQYAQVLGLVSHFSPYTGDTYVIPIDKALSVARRILTKARNARFSSVIEEVVDETGIATLDEKKRMVQILKGPLAGTVFSSPSASSSSPGGGDSVGGGGDSVGGGGDSVGGGGDSVGGGGDTAAISSYRVPSTSQAMGPGTFEQVQEEIANPKAWGIKPTRLIELVTVHPLYAGTREHLAYRPGVQIFEKAGASYLQCDKENISHLQNLIRCLRNNPEPELKTEAIPYDFPKALSLQNQARSGMLVLGRLSSLKSSATPQLSLVSSGNFIGNVSQVRLVRANGQATAEFLSGRFGILSYEFPDEFVGIGQNFFQYRGPIVTRTVPFLVSQTFPMRSYGVVTVQYDAAKNEYEIKMVIAMPGLKASSATNLWEVALWQEGIPSGHTLITALYCPAIPQSIPALQDYRTMTDREIEFQRYQQYNIDLIKREPILRKPPVIE